MSAGNSSPVNVTEAPVIVSNSSTTTASLQNVTDNLSSSSSVITTSLAATTSPTTTAGVVQGTAGNEDDSGTDNAATIAIVVVVVVAVLIIGVVVAIVIVRRRRQNSDIKATQLDNVYINTPPNSPVETGLSNGNAPVLAVLDDQCPNPEAGGTTYANDGALDEHSNTYINAGQVDLTTTDGTYENNHQPATAALQTEADEYIIPIDPNHADSMISSSTAKNSTCSGYIQLEDGLTSYTYIDSVPGRLQNSDSTASSGLYSYPNPGMGYQKPETSRGPRSAADPPMVSSLRPVSEALSEGDNIYCNSPRP